MSDRLRDYLRHHPNGAYFEIPATALYELIKEKQKETVDQLATRIVGPRCETTDKEDFPDVDYKDPKSNRCPACEVWEQADSLVAELENKGGNRWCFWEMAGS